MSNDVQAIRLLKARYFRFIDEKRWDELNGLFTRDLVFDVRGGMAPSTLADSYDDPPIQGADAAVAFLRKALDPAISIHQGFMPEIEITGLKCARGIWAMSDIIRAPEGGPYREIRGHGHYHETYRKCSGVWHIAKLRLTRLAVDIT
ncbi:nuclear transport factor 2 family protein [Croceicoccus mobilis]|uniref:Bile-acid 7-alpha-dehydratase n=1 Tax=Croceicoccus mobilis TaxID=1703339 RepID=A0A916Z892_9SPHN|nr:nuclear transport factor 2 family protein [Croceicoccus mobilis]GGD80843.1 bile-acid 7-alpha-dehydratase [Croceicoccus mobilis]